MASCPIHLKEFVDTDDPMWRGKLRYCPVNGCQHCETVPSKVRTNTRVRQAKLPGLDPGIQSRAIEISEKALVDQATQWGGLKGYIVLEIGQKVQYPRCPACKKAVRRITCPGCGEEFTPQLISQSTPGTPDTFWNHPSWGNEWRGIEAKKNATAFVREEQQRLINLGVVDVAWSLEMFQATL